MCCASWSSGCESCLYVTVQLNGSPRLLQWPLAPRLYMAAYGHSCTQIKGRLPSGASTWWLFRPRRFDLQLQLLSPSCITFALLASCCMLDSAAAVLQARCTVRDSKYCCGCLQDKILVQGIK
jgi:hypothetical protein